MFSSAILQPFYVLESVRLKKKRNVAGWLQDIFECWRFSDWPIWLPTAAATRVQRRCAVMPLQQPSAVRPARARLPKSL